MRGSEYTQSADGFESSPDHHALQTKRNIIAVLLLFATTAVAMAALIQLSNQAPNVNSNSITSVAGTPVCLPHKDTSGPTTLECALGIKGDDGRHYALKQAPDSLLQEDFGAHVIVRGTLAAPEPNNIYAVAGTITVESVTRQ